MPRQRKDIFPRKDASFSAWTDAFDVAVHAWWSAQGLDPADLEPLEKAIDDWRTAYPEHVAAIAAARAATELKEKIRADVEQAVRPLAKFIQAYPTTTNADRATIGITVREASASPSPAPTSRPLALVESGQRLTHTLRLVDESTPTRRAKPRGTLGAEVWVKLVEPGNGQWARGNGPDPASSSSSSPLPTAHSPLPSSLGDPATFSFLTMTTKPSFRADFKPGEGGKTAVYMARWVNTRGEKGPWSEIATATVAA